MCRAFRLETSPQWWLTEPLEGLDSQRDPPASSLAIPLAAAGTSQFVALETGEGDQGERGGRAECKDIQDVTSTNNTPQENYSEIPPTWFGEKV